MVVGDWPVLDHREDENELQRAGDGSGHEAHPAPPGPPASGLLSVPPSFLSVSQTRKRHIGEGRANVSVWAVEKADDTKRPGHDGQLAVEGERSSP